MKKIVLVLIGLFTFLVTQSQDFQWAKQIGGVSPAKGNAVAVDAQGNVYTTGRFSQTMDFDPGPGTFTLPCNNSYKMFISKLDAAGNFIWAKGVLGNGYAEGLAITIDQTGNIYTTGNYSYIVDFDPGVATYTDICIPVYGGGVFVLKLDAAGNFLWAKQLGEAGQASSGNFGRSITTDVLGNVYTSGDYVITSDFDPGIGTYTLAAGSSNSGFVSKLDPSGNFVWAKGFLSTDYCTGYSINVDATGNVYTSGTFWGNTDFDPDLSSYTITSQGTRDIFISKLNGSGNFLWAKTMGGKGWDEGFDCKLDAFGNVYTTGHFNDTVDFDPGVGTASLISKGSSDIFISKLNSAGNFVWVKSMGGTSTDKSNSIDIDVNGNLYSIGNFRGTCDFDPGVGTFNLTSFGTEDVFISKLDGSGNFAGAKQLGGSLSDFGNAIALDAFGSLFATGSFQDIADFDPGIGVYNLTSVTADIFIYKMSQTTMGLKENISKINMSMFPNPTNGSLTFELDPESYLELSGKIQIEILNAIGQVIAKETMESNQLKIDISNFNTGIYIVKVMNENTSVATQKIIKQ